MINIGILDFLMSTAHHIFAINCSSNFEYTDNLFEKILTAKYCTADINLGVFYIRKNSDNNYLLIDEYKSNYLNFIIYYYFLYGINKTAGHRPAVRRALRAVRLSPSAF